MDNKGMSQDEIGNLFKPKAIKTDAKLEEALEKVKIHNLTELKRLIKRLEDSSTDKSAPIVIDTKKANMADETYSGMVTIPSTGGQSTLRRTIIDGFDMIKGYYEQHNAGLEAQQMEEEYGGFMPAVVPNPADHHTWIDTFIDRNLGGKREGLSIVWNLPEGRFKLDPWSCSLEKIDAS